MWQRDERGRRTHHLARFPKICLPASEEDLSRCVRRAERTHRPPRRQPLKCFSLLTSRVSTRFAVSTQAVNIKDIYLFHHCILCCWLCPGKCTLNDGGGVRGAPLADPTTLNTLFRLHASRNHVANGKRAVIPTQATHLPRLCSSKNMLG